MNIDYIHAENVGKRFIRKEFKCLSCFRRSKKLVHILINKIQCPFCYSDNCQEIIFIKGNNDNSEIDNSSLKTNISLKDEESFFNNFGSSKNNIIYNNISLKDNHDESKKEKIKNSFLCKKKLLENIKPFSTSPFSKSVQHHEFEITDILEDNALSPIPSSEFFIDNFCSNFITNFDNPLGRMVFIQMHINNNSKIKTMNPLNPKEIRQIKKFEMSENYCKKTGNSYELPNCIFCLKDILLETNCFLLRCGHLIHDHCLFEWIKEHRICPVCKFSLIKRGATKKSSLDLIIDESIKEKEKIEKIFPEEMNENRIINIKGNELNVEEDISKYINDEDNNINIIGEKLGNLKLVFDEE